MYSALLCLVAPLMGIANAIPNPVAAPAAEPSLYFGPGPVVTCSIELYSDELCTSKTHTTDRVPAASTCLATAGFKSFKISGFCPRGISITEYPDAECKASGIVEPVFNATGAECHQWEVYNPTSIHAHAN